MKKILFALLIATASIGAQAQVLDAISGHITDFKSRAFTAQEEIGGKILQSGKIDEKAKGQDLIHNSKGLITVREKDGKRYIQLEKSFYSSFGPDYHVYISPNKNIKDAEDFVNQTELGRLKRGSGASYYELPEGAVVGSVTIWCKQFKEYIGSANIN